MLRDDAQMLKADEIVNIYRKFQSTESYKANPAPTRMNKVAFSLATVYSISREPSLLMNSVRGTRNQVCRRVVSTAPSRKVQ